GCQTSARSSTVTARQPRGSRTPSIRLAAIRSGGADGTRPKNGVRWLQRQSRYNLARMKAEIAIVRAGYVGVPLAQVFADAGRSVLLVDVQADRVEQLNRGE